MSKKILTVFAPVAAIVASMAIPSLAQATQAQCGTSECATNTRIRGQSSNLIAQTQTSHNHFECVNFEFQGELQTTQAPTIDAHITNSALAECLIKTQSGPWLTVDFSVNASASEPWQLQIQQPSGAEPGAPFVAHIVPFSGKTIQFTQQVQEVGFSVYTCHFSASNLQLVGTGQNDVLFLSEFTFHLEGRQGPFAPECGTINSTLMHYSASVQLETDEASPKAIVVHMTE